MHFVLRTLSLQRNKLTYVTPEALNCLEITDLDLSKNHLQSLLISVSTLEKLDLSNNRFSNLSDDAFSNLTNLDALTMDNNYLEAIPKTVSALPTLVWLLLKNNKINSNSVERGLQSIESLELSNNLITRIELDQHHNYRDQNHIEDFPENALANNKYLQTLNLAQNRLTGPLEYRFKHNEGLDDLRRIKTDGISDQVALTYLDISNNNLTSLEFDGFGKFSYLQRFVFVGNRFETFSISDLLAAFEDLESIGLEVCAGFEKTTYDCDSRECNFKITQFDENEDVNSLKFVFDEDERWVTVKFDDSRLHTIPSTLFADNGDKIYAFDASKSNLLSLRPDTFSMAPKLKSLNLKGNLISELHNHMFTNNDKLKTIEFSMNRISKMGNYTFEGATSLLELRLSHNLIRTLPQKLVQGLYELTVLHIDHNRIAGIEEGLFEDLRMLKELYLNNNQVEKLSNNLFIGLTQLNTFDLQHNRIALIELDTFKPLEKLKKLRLNSNNLKAIAPATFISLNLLEDLDLTNNFFNDLPRELFLNTVSLKILKISNNLLEQIDSDLFITLKNLKMLELEHNKLESLNGALFQNLGRLEHLDLENNNLRHIEPGTFDKLKRLQLLDLISNGITSIDGGLFRKLRFVTQLFLANNEIEELKTGALDGMPRLKALFLENNK
ncbi:AGAP007060-PA-like protein [Anopheles sinensis]|uniref:AGAP007060-PA-like protein n=1 Tax=Anopheles sinensis TaxID=74873 RepID=A0A084WJR7_ANOSI|nr:AGAP007060-PA-like protein [Anopheles sinensis]